MTRVYRTKGDEAKRHHLTIPMSIGMMERLREHSSRIGRPMADVARDLIDAGVPTATDEATTKLRGDNEQRNQQYRE